MKKIILVLLIASPVVDYLYQFQLASFFGVSITPNRIWKAAPIIIAAALFVFNPKKIIINIPLYLLLLITVCSASHAFLNFAPKGDVIDVWIRFVSSLIFFLYIGNCLKVEDMFLVFKYVSILAIIPIIISFMQYFDAYPYYDFDYVFGKKVGRLSGGYAKSVALVAVLFYVYIYLLYVYMKGNISRVMKIAVTFYLAIILVVVFLTYHRASIAIFTFTSIVLMYFYGKYRLLFFVLVAGSIILVVYGLAQFNELFKTVGMSDSASFMRGRGGTWSAYLNEYFRSSFIEQTIGKGHPVLNIQSTAGDDYRAHVAREPHSDYLRILYQYGYIGFFSFITFMSGIFIFLWKVINNKNAFASERNLAVMMFGVAIGLFLYSITIEPTRYPSFYWYFASSISILIICKRKRLKGIYSYRLQNSERI